MAATRAPADQPVETVICRDVYSTRNAREIAVVQVAGLACNQDLSNLIQSPKGAPIQYSTPATHRRSSLPDNLPELWRFRRLSPARILGTQPRAWSGRHARPMPGWPAQSGVSARDFYASLPPNQNSASHAARLLAIPYSDMDHRLAAIAWGQLLELDSFDAPSLRDFYETHIDGGPECRGLRCPE